MANHHSETSDLCAGLNIWHKKAIVWFFGAIALGVFVTCKLSAIDKKLYDTKNPYLDMEEYRINREASNSLPSEHIDPRQQY